jgi:pimeloyl-ACP methyl ester carboxylesterase
MGSFQTSFFKNFIINLIISFHLLSTNMQIKFLTLQGYRTVTFDNRGVGRSSCNLAPSTTAIMAEDTMELMVRVLGWAPSKTHVISISMGGMVALEMAARLAEGKSEWGNQSGCTRFLSLTLMVTQVSSN